MKTIRKVYEDEKPYPTCDVWRGHEDGEDAGGFFMYEIESDDEYHTLCPSCYQARVCPECGGFIFDSEMEESIHGYHFDCWHEHIQRVEGWTCGVLF